MMLWPACVRTVTVPETPRVCHVPAPPVAPEVTAIPCLILDGGEQKDYVCITKEETDKLVNYLLNQAEYVTLVLQCKGTPTVVAPEPPKV